MSLYSIQIEKYVLGGLLKHPDVLSEVDSYLTLADFYNAVHQSIFSVIRNSHIAGETVDRVLVSNKILSLGITAKDEVGIYNYLEAIEFSAPKPKAIPEYSRELIKYRIRREIDETASDIQDYAKNSREDSADDIIAKSDSIYSQKILSYELDDNPENVFESLLDDVEEAGENPSDDTGLVTPYPEFNRLFGGLRDANIYAIVSRPAQGKTTFINDICLKTSVINKVPALILDTEMSTKEIKFRMAAAETGIPHWYLETGNWRKNEEMYKKFRDYQENFESKFNDSKYFHYHVKNKTVDEVCAIIRRWHMKHVGRGNKCIIAYDYVKLTGEKVDKNWAEYQAIGEKIDKLKRISEELSAPIITAMQMNRSGESHNRNSRSLTDDSSAISLSDRLQWFASFVGIFRRKTLDEIAVDGQDYGTHKLLPIKTRFQGKDAAGHQDLIRRPIIEENNGAEVHREEWSYNYLNFEVSNFSVESKGSLQNIVDQVRQRFDIAEQRVAGDGDTNL